MYIIQTNILIDDKGIERDFQSMMYQIKEQTWDEFKDYILSDGDYTMKIIYGTMTGLPKPRQSKVTSILINDEKHLSVILNLFNSKSYEAKFYMVTDEQFNDLR